MTRTGRGSDQFSLRLPEGLRDRVREVADANMRSMNAEIVCILERAIFDALETEKGDVSAS